MHIFRFGRFLSSLDCIKKCDDLLLAGEHEQFRIELLSSKGESQIMLYQFEEAKASFLEALTICPRENSRGMIKLFYHLIRVYYELKDYEKAIMAGESCVEMNRHYNGVYKYYALAHKDSGDLKRAIEVMSRAVLYESPWDESNRAVVKADLQSLLLITSEQLELDVEESRTK